MNQAGFTYIFRNTYISTIKEKKDVNLRDSRDAHERGRREERGK